MLRKLLFGAFRVAIDVYDKPRPIEILGNYLCGYGYEIVLLDDKPRKRHDRSDSLTILVNPGSLGNNQRFVADLAFAIRIVEAHQACRVYGRAVIALRGILVDELPVARRVV